MDLGRPDDSAAVALHRMVFCAGQRMEKENISGRAAGCRMGVRQMCIRDSRGDELTIYTYNFKGTLAKITEVIAKNGGDIRNIIQRDTDVMGLQEVYMRIVCKDFGKLVKALKKKGFDARVIQNEKK